MIGVFNEDFESLSSRYTKALQSKESVVWDRSAPVDKI